MNYRRKDKKEKRVITIYDVLDTKWFVQLVKSVAGDYDLPLSDRSLKIIRKVLKKELENAIYDILGQTKPFRAVKRGHR